MSRNSVAQKPPDPGLDWAKFPLSRLRAGTLLWRAARRGREPWWFCTCGDCRFDLDPPRGTCYAGADELSGILESIGYEWASGQPLTLAFLRMRTLHSSAEVLTGPLANLASRKAVGFRVTNELSDMTPYDTPRAFARLLDAARKAGRQVFAGIRFRTRFDTGSTTRGVALFGDAGLRSGVPTVEHEITDELVDALTALGLVIDVPPALPALTLAQRG